MTYGIGVKACGVCRCCCSESHLGPKPNWLDIDLTPCLKGSLRISGLVPCRIIVAITSVVCGVQVEGLMMEANYCARQAGGPLNCVVPLNFYNTAKNLTLTSPPSPMLSRCTRRLASYCTIDNRVFRDQCRHTSGSSHFSRGDDLGPLREEAHQTFRIRKEGVGNELPLPPLLDPLVIEKKSRWRNTKNRPNPAEFTPFQKKLQANPYGE